MAQTTSHNATMSREAAADYLRSIADGLDGGQGSMVMRVGNKDVRLSPPETIDAEVSVTERVRRIRKDVEEVTIQFRWNPVEGADESDPDVEDESGAETDG